MGELRIDPRLVALGFDRNQNGVVHDDLRIDAPGLGGDGGVSVDQLAAALGRDQVVISNGVVQARKGAVNFPELPESRTIRSIYNIAVQSEWHNYGSATTEAIASMRTTLRAIVEVSNDNSDFRSRKIHEIANDALWRTSFSVTQENYAVLRETMRHIQAIAEVPPQPAAVVKDLSDRIAANAAAIKGQESALALPAVAGAVEKATTKARAERQAAAAVPTWQKWLIFGLIRSWSHNRGADKIEKNLAALQAADPGIRRQKLADLATLAYDLSVDAEAVRNLDDSQKLGNDAKEVIKLLDELKKDIEAQTRQINDLLKKIGEN